MNLLFIPSDNDKYHGAFLSMVKLIQILRDQYNHQIFVILPYEGDGKELLDNCNIESMIIPSYTWVIDKQKENDKAIAVKQIVKRTLNLRAISLICKVIKERNIEIVHINTSWSYVGAKAAIQCKIPLVWHIREFLEEDQKLCIWHKKHGYQLMDKADYTIAISEKIYEKYNNILSNTRLTVIMNGIDPSRYYYEDHMILQEETIKLLIIGGVTEGKGQAIAIQACVELKKLGISNFILNIVGYDQSAYADSLKQYVKENNAEDNIRFIGKDDCPERYYKQTDIYLMCSDAEAFGRVTVEAMMAGCLVIGSDSGATPELITDGETGILFRKRDIMDLTSKIRYVLMSKETCVHMAKSGQKKAVSSFSAEENAKQVNMIYSAISQIDKK